MIWDPQDSGSLEQVLLVQPVHPGHFQAKLSAGSEHACCFVTPMHAAVAGGAEPGAAAAAAAAAPAGRAQLPAL
jgi:hypothetical protein